jgi:hypothetical protein
MSIFLENIIRVDTSLRATLRLQFEREWLTS